MRTLRKIALAPRAIWKALQWAIADADQQGQLGDGVIFAEGVILRGAERITHGSNLFLDQRAYLSTNTVNDRRGFIRLGDNVEIGPYSVIWGGGGVVIGNNVHVGAHVHITSMEGHQVPPSSNDPFQPLTIDCATVTVGDHVLICSGAVVVPGVTIGHHAMVGAGAVVTEDVPPYALVAGVPARIVRYSNEPRPASSATTGSIPA